MKKKNKKKKFIKFLKAEKQKINKDTFVSFEDLEPYKYAITETLKIITGKNE